MTFSSFHYSFLWDFGEWYFVCSPFMVVRWIRYFSHEMVVSEADDFINILLILEVCVRSCVIQKRTELITIVPFWITHYQRTLYKRDFQNLTLSYFCWKSHNRNLWVRFKLVIIWPFAKSFVTILIVKTQNVINFVLEYSELD